jgi:hypothetical protein
VKAISELGFRLYENGEARAKEFTELRAWIEFHSGASWEVIQLQADVQELKTNAATSTQSLGTIEGLLREIRDRLPLPPGTP